MSDYRSQNLSIVLITYNNVETIERALSSVSWADEIIVIDRGSIDGTAALARRYTEKVYFHPATNLSILKNYGFSLVKCEWILYLEPYEWVEEMLKHEIDGILLNPNRDIQGWEIPRKIYFMDRWLSHGRLYPRRQVRLFRRDTGTAKDDDYFNVISVEGNVQKMDRAIASEQFPSLESLFANLQHSSAQAAYHLIEAGEFTSRESRFKQSTLNLIARPLITFLHRYALSLGCLDGFGGLSFALAQSFHCYLKYAKYRTLLQVK